MGDIMRFLMGAIIVLLSFLIIIMLILIYIASPCVRAFIKRYKAILISGLLLPIISGVIVDCISPLFRINDEPEISSSPVSNDTLEYIDKNDSIESREEKSNLKILEEGKELIKEKEYEKAIEILDKILPNNSEYSIAQSIKEEAKESLATNILNEAEIYKDNGDLIEAINILSNIPSIVSGDSGILKAISQYKEEYKKKTFKDIEDLLNLSKYDEAKVLLEKFSNTESFKDDKDIKSKKLEIYKLEILSNVEQLKQNADVEGIISELNRYYELKNDNDIQALNNFYFPQYVDSIRVRSLKVIRETFEKDEARGNPSQDVEQINYDDNYLNAISIVNEALRKYPQNSELLKVSEEIEQYRPERISTLSVFDMEYVNTVWHSTMKTKGTEIDNTGIERKDIIEGGRFVYTYLIDKKYDCISGTIFITQKHKTIKQDAYIEVYGDGRFIDKVTITSGELPKHFNFNITGVERLVIIFNGYDGSWTTGTKYYGAISGLVLRKKPLEKIESK